MLVEVLQDISTAIGSWSKGETITLAEHIATDFMRRGFVRPCEEAAAVEPATRTAARRRPRKRASSEHQTDSGA